MLCASKSQSTFSTNSNMLPLALALCSTGWASFIQRSVTLSRMTWQFLHRLSCFLTARPSHTMPVVPPGVGVSCGWAALGQLLQEAVKGGQRTAGNWEAPSKGNHFMFWWQNQVKTSGVKGFSFVREKYQVIKVMWMANFDKTSFKINEKQGLWYE